jgi:hypothetical protein
MDSTHAHAADAGPTQEPAPAAAAVRGPYPWLGYLEELREAVRNDHASFAQTFMAMYMAYDPYGNPSVTAEAADLYPTLLERFQATYGAIVESRYGESAAAGAVLLGAAESARDPVAREADPDDDQSPALDVAAPLAGDLDAFVWEQLLSFDSADSAELLADILALRDRVTTFLPASGRAVVGRDIALRRLYGIARELIENVDAEQQRVVAQSPEARFQAQRPSERFARQVHSLRARLIKVESVYVGSVQRLAQREYVAGMFKGLAIGMAPVAIALAVATAWLDFDAAWVAAMSAGAIGAVLSVLQRIGRGPLDLGPEGDQDTFRLAGYVRPVIGAVLGVASFVLIDGGLVSIVAASTGTERALYYAGVAFLAGFSERFARDILVSPTVNATSGAVREPAS